MNFLQNLSFTLFIAISLIACDNNEGTVISRVNLAGTGLRDVPDSVLKNKKLVHLNLGAGHRTIYPPLSAIADTGMNQISSLPEAIGEFKMLQTLVLNFNNLKNLPSSFSGLDKLEELDLSFNSKFEILKEIEKLKELPQLKKLNLAGIEQVVGNEDKIRTALPGIKIYFSPVELVKDRS